MRLIRATIENFLIIKRAEISLATPSLSLVLGYSSDGGKADSNGVGKSSVFEAICWCLYGKTYKGLAHDDVVSNKSKGGTRVSVELVIGDRLITVVRHRAHKKHNNKLHIFDDGKNISPFRQQDADALLKSLLPISYTAFKHVVYFGQFMPDKFLSLNDAGRKQLLEELLGLEAFSDAEKKVKLHVKEMKSKLLTLTGYEDALKESIEEGEKLLEKAKLEKAEKLKSIMEEITTLALSRRVLKKKEQKTRALRDVLLADKDEITTKIFKVQKKLKKLESKHTEEVIACGGLDKDLLAIGKMSRKLSRLSICSECGQEVSREHVETKLAELGKERTDVEDRIHAHAEVRATLSDSIRAKEKYLELIGMDMDAKEDEIDTITEALNELLLQLHSNAERQNSLYHEREVIQNSDSSMEATITSQQVRLKGLSKEIVGIREELPYLEYWEKGFSASGVRAMLLDDVIVYLNNRMNHYSRVMSDGEIAVQLSSQTKLKSGQVREKMSISASTGGAGYLAASGGQQRRMDLAVHFALSDLTSTVTGHKINVLICDEVLDCVDETGTEAILHMLEDKVRQGVTVFLIAHTDALKHRIQRTLLVTQKNGVSTVKEML